MPVALNTSEVEELVRTNLLAPDKRGDRRAIGYALGRLLDRFPPKQWAALLPILSPLP